VIESTQTANAPANITQYQVSPTDGRSLVMWCSVISEKLKNELQLAARYVHNRGFTRGYSPSKDQIRKKMETTIHTDVLLQYYYNIL